MFIHLLKYRIKSLLREKDLLGWVFAFPIVLGTFFYLSFGNIMNSEDYNFSAIPVALVSEAGADSNFEQVLSSLSQDNEDKMFNVTKTNGEVAKQMLKDGKIDGILMNSGEPSVTVAGEGMNQSIIKSFLEAYLKNKYAYRQIESSHPEKLLGAAKLLSEDISYNKEISYSNTKMDNMSQYFFALIAMTCMYGSIIGRKCVEDIQANISALGARREVSPAHKLTVICADFCGSVLVNYSSVVLLLFYLTVILKVDFGTKIPYILLTGFAGSVIGVSMGTFIGSIGKMSAHVKAALVSAISLILSFLSGLMINSMKDIIEHTVPFVNRINPAALITDCLYSLNMFDSYDRFYNNVAIMGVIALLFIFGSYLLLRRNHYASI
jgi:ABC-2 type transport system permease protein